MYRLLRAVKPFALVLFRLFAPLLKMAGFDAKSRYEFMFWQAAKQREGELGNAHYQTIYTELIGLTTEHYRDKKILDVGCGPRGSLEWANMAAERVGLDPLVDKYRELGIDKHQMRYVNAGSENIPFDDAYFDIVLALNSLDHVDDLQKTLSEIQRITAIGGEFIVMTHIHDEPTIAEPVSIPWHLTELLRDGFEVIEENHYEVRPEDQSVKVALDHKIPFDHSNSQARYGVLVARLKRR